MWQYKCAACGALYESPKKADLAICRTPGCQGPAVRITGKYTHAYRGL